MLPGERKLTVAEKRLQQWKDSVANSPTLSRLHVLLSMMDSCIKWEKSAENAVRTFLSVSSRSFNFISWHFSMCHLLKNHGFALLDFSHSNYVQTV